ncbi:MAG: SDR family oxidoreductase, partial [Bacteroidota bacterium]
MTGKNIIFENEWALILGGSSGMGLASAQKLAAEGMNLCIVHRDRKQGTEQLEAAILEMQKSGVQIIRFNVDALRAEKRQEIVHALQTHLGEKGRIKLLLHAIARGNLKLLAPYRDLGTTGKASDLATSLKETYRQQKVLLSNSDFQATLEAMALSLYDWVAELFSAGLFAADARVLGLTSEGSTKAWRTYAAVSTAKAALEAICRSIALEFAPYGIRCNILQPGVTDTPSLRMIPGNDQLKQNARERNPFQRLTTPEDVANVVYLMCTQEASWINGAIIPVDGGEK